MYSFPYPVQYFDCGKAADLPEPELQAEIKRLAGADACVGWIRGETGIPGLRLDFNSGLRLEVPEGNFHVRIFDHNTERVFFDDDVSACVLISLEKYYICWAVEVERDNRPVFFHVFSPKGQMVQFLGFEKNSLGDTLNFLPYVRAFRDRHEAKVAYCVPTALEAVARRCYPDIPIRREISRETYATYYFSSGNGNSFMLPFDMRSVPLYHVPMLMLGFEHPVEGLRWNASVRQIKEAYVCIGVQASTTAKGWLWPDGWNIVVRYLKSLGYRVLCIDAMESMTVRGIRVDCPEEAENFTGRIPLEERADMLAHAELFVGLSSGLAWLANLAGCPVVMIGGFTSYCHEFPQAYRVYNPFVCNGCVDDCRVNYFPDCFCPRHEGDSLRELECSRSISPRQVIRAIHQALKERTSDDFQ